MSSEERLGETGALLLRRNVLTRWDLRALASIGVETPEALIALACDPGRRQRATEQFNLPEDALFVAGLLAKLLTVQGPGAIIAQRAAAETALSCWADPENRESNQDLLECEPAVFVKRLAERVENSVNERWTDTQSVGNRNTFWLWLALVVGIPAVEFVLQWNSFFMPTKGEDVLVAVRGFVRAGVLIDTGLELAMMLGVVVVSELFSAISRRISPADRIYDNYLSWRDRLIAAEAYSLLPPLRAKIGEWLLNNFWIPMLVVIIVVTVARVPLDWNTTSRWNGYVVLVSIAIPLLLVFVLQAQAFSRLALRAKWASPTRERFAECQILRSSLGIGVSALMLYFAILPASRILLGTLSNWYEQQQGLRTATFEQSLDQVQVAPGQQAAWPGVRAEWITWSQRQANASLTTTRGFSGALLRDADVFGSILAVGVLGVLLAFALAQYLYASRPKGTVSLGIWVAALVASEYLPNRMAQAIGISEATATGVILMLALAAFISIVGELGILWRGRHPERICLNPACSAVVAAEANFCSICGTTIRHDMDTEESRL